MSEQNRGPIYNVELPDELPIGEHGWTQAVPRREELELVRKKVGDRTVAALEVALDHLASLSEQLLESTKNYADSLDGLLARSSMVLTQCRVCSQSVITLGDGLALCKTCAEKAGEL